MPSLQSSVLVHLIKTDFPVRIVAEKDVRDAVPVKVANPHHIVGGRGAADAVPPAKQSILEAIKAKVAVRIVAEQNIRRLVAVKVANPDDAVGRRRTSNRMPPLCN